MVNEVNKIIYNALTSGEEVLLPDIGTLYTVRRAAEYTSKRTIAPPRITVEFSSSRPGVSLIDLISRTAGIGTDAAADIYERWRDKTLSDSTLSIAGIGTLRGKSFAADEAFLSTLNPAGTAPVRAVGRRSSNGALWCTAALLLTVCIGAAAWYMLSYRQAPHDSRTIHEPQPKRLAASSIEQRHALPAENTAPEKSARTTDKAVSPDAEPATVKEPQAAPAVTDAARSVAPDNIEPDATVRFRVIIGSYSTRENAERAIAAASRTQPDLQYEIRPLGRLHAVAAFGSATRDRCEEFVRSHRRDFPQAWIHPVNR